MTLLSLTGNRFIDITLRIFKATGKLNHFIICTVLIMSLYSSLQGQILQDSATVKVLKKDIDFIYNFDFRNAEKINSEIEKSYPGHPANFLLKGMTTYWQNYPLIPTSGATGSFISDLEKCIALCDKNKNKDTEGEILLINLCARGLLLLYYTDNDLSFEVFPLASGTYQCIKKSFNFTSEYKDLLFFTGVYNYYREAYPEAHPVYKTLAFIFPKGDKQKGINDLIKVAQGSILMKAEAYTFLNDIYLSFENDYIKSVNYSRKLHLLYPNNPQYLGVYIKNLLLTGNYEEAEKEIRTSASIHNDFFQSQISIFNGILQEKKYHNHTEAEPFYNRGIKNIAPFREPGYEYAAYGYYGLSRIAGSKGDLQNQKAYRKLAMKLSVFRKINFD